MIKNFRIWCKGTSTNSNFNTPKWVDVNDLELQKYHPFFSIFESSDFEVCQFTGLIDENDIEIYEDDLVQFYNDDVLLDIPIRRVEYSEGFLMFTDGEYGFDMSSLRRMGLSLKVIGNIFENAAYNT